MTVNVTTKRGGQYPPRRIGGVLAALLALLPTPATAMKMSETLGSVGRLTSLSGSVGVETEDYSYTSKGVASDRKKLSTRFEINGNGYVWDPRFALVGAGLTLQRDNIQSTTGESSYNLLGYRFNTTFFANRPHPLSIFANRTQNTVSDYSRPSYQTITDTMGARWSMEDKWLGRTSLYIDHTSSESQGTLNLRSDRTLSLGFDSRQTLRQKQWGESELSYGYRYTGSEEDVYGSKQNQNFLYLNDRTALGDKANLTGNMTYYTRDDQSGLLGGLSTTSNFFGLNSALTVQQSKDFRHYYNLNLGFNEFGSSKSSTQGVTGGADYRLSDKWQAAGSLGLSTSQSESASGGVSQDTNSTTGGGSISYTDQWGDYMTSGGYSLALMQSSTTGHRGRNSATQTGTLGYTRMNTPRYTDSLQLRLSQIQGSETSGSELNLRYSVSSRLTASDRLQGSAEYRQYQQTNAVYDASAVLQNSYSLDSTSTNLDFGWQHQFSQSSSFILSAGANSSQSQNLSNDLRYVQVRTNTNPLRNLQWDVLARLEQVDGLGYGAGNKMTLESNLNYRFGKWQAIARYRMRDAKTEISPFKEQTVTLFIKRNYDFRF